MPKSKSSLLILVAGAAASSLLLRPAPAYACSCSRPGVEVSPGAGAPAPTNTLIRVTWWTGEVKVDETTFQVIPAGADKPKDKPKKKSKKDKAAAKDAEPAAPTGAAVELETVAFTTGQVRTVTLKPKAPLLPATRYEVRVASMAGEKVGVVGEFMTASASDEKPPEWSGVAKTTYVQQQAVCCNCSTSDPYLQLDLADAAKLSDDATAADALVFGVWMDDGSKLEPGATLTTQPLVITRAWGGKLFLGHKSICSPVNFDIPGKQTTLKLRVAPIDLAGRVGKVVSVSVDVPKPKDPPKPTPPAKK